MHTAYAVDLGTYRQHGYLFDPFLLELEEVAACCLALEAVRQELLALGEPQHTATPLEFDPPLADGTPGPVRRIRGLAGCDDYFATLAEHPNLVGWATQLLGTTPRLASSCAMFSQPDCPTIVPWSQEAARFAPLPRQMVCIQLALDDATEDNGCMVLLRRSHRDGLAAHSNFHGAWLADATPPAAALASASAQPVLLPSGGGIVYDGLLLCGTTPNQELEPRRAVQFCYVAEDDSARPQD